MQCYIVDGIIYNHWISGAINRGRQPFIFCGSHACILYGYYHSAYSTVLDIAYSTIRASLKVAVHYSIIQFQVNTIILATTISTTILWELWHTSNTDGLCTWTQLCIMCLSSCVLFAKLYLHHTLTGPLFDPLWKNKAYVEWLPHTQMTDFYTACGILQFQFIHSVYTTLIL